MKFVFQMFVREFQYPTETLAVKDTVLWFESATGSSHISFIILRNRSCFIACNNFRLSNVVLLHWLLSLVKLKSSIEQRLCSWPLASIILTHCLTDRPQTMVAPEKVLLSSVYGSFCSKRLRFSQPWLFFKNEVDSHCLYYYSFGCFRRHSCCNCQRESGRSDRSMPHRIVGVCRVVGRRWTQVYVHSVALCSSLAYTQGIM